MGKGSRVTIAPLVIPSSAAWFDANDPAGDGSQQVDASSVSEFTDKGPRQLDVTQGTGANQPVYELNEQAGKPIVRFGSISSLANTSFSNIKEFTIFAVSNTTDSSTAGVLAVTTSGGTVDTGFSIYYVSDTSYRFRLKNSGGSQADLDITCTASAMSILETRYDGTTQYASVNGGSESSNTTSITSDTFAEIYLGQLDSTTSFPLTGDVAEIVIFDRALGSDERDFVREYLADKWGIDL